jgi:hypothetical protein
LLFCLPLDPRFAGSYPAESDVFLRAIKIPSITSFGQEVKPWAPCHKILLHVKGLLICDRDTDTQKSAAVSRPASPSFAARCLLQPEQRTLVDTQRIIRIQVGSTIPQEIVPVSRDAFYDITP